MAKYILIRKAAEGKAVRGKLYVIPPSGKESQLSFFRNTLENSDFLIPAGTYKVQVTMSPKFKRLLPILLNVPGRSGIRFHRGTRPEHSRGCILIREPEIERRLTCNMLAEQQLGEQTLLEIRD